MTNLLRETPAARRLRRRRLRRRVVAVVAAYFLTLTGLSLACGWAYFRLLEAPGLGLAQVEVNGLARLGREEVLAAAGVAEGAPIVALDLRRLEIRLERLCWVESARARLGWPRRLVIDVEEKRPVALIQLDSLYYLDKNGRLIKRLSPLEGMNLPVITGLTPPQFNSSRKLLCSRVIPLLAQADGCGENQAPLAGEVSELNVGSGGRLSLYTTEGLLVRLGERDWRAALSEAGRVISELRRRACLAEVAAVDVSCPSRAFVRFSRKLMAASGEARGALGGRRETCGQAG
jgi:cell division protein FtsQ